MNISKKINKNLFRFCTISATTGRNGFFPVQIELSDFSCIQSFGYMYKLAHKLSHFAKNFPVPKQQQQTAIFIFAFKANYFRIIFFC